MIKQTNAIFFIFCLISHILLLFPFVFIFCLHFTGYCLYIKILTTFKFTRIFYYSSHIFMLITIINFLYYYYYAPVFVCSVNVCVSSILSGSRTQSCNLAYNDKQQHQQINTKITLVKNNGSVYHKWIQKTNRPNSETHASFYRFIYLW